mmetsp:Transcript_48885/g.153555  ORF Transcript_48885/g.153555 Transcript_48885/m.153555 type:complete len:224 (+) Transcript_48885:743-1414(+)
MNHNGLAMKVLEDTLDSTKNSVGSGIIGVHRLIGDGGKHVWAILREVVHIARGCVQIASSVHGSVQLVQESCGRLHQFVLVHVEYRVVRSRSIANNLGSSEARVVGSVLHLHALCKSNGLALSSFEIRVDPKAESTIARTVARDLGCRSNHQVHAQVWEGSLKNAGRMLELFGQKRCDHRCTSIVSFQVVPGEIPPFLIGEPRHLVYAPNRIREVGVSVPLLR